MGYGKKTDPSSGKTLDLDATYKGIIKPAVEKTGYQCVRGDEILESGIIDKRMYALLISADLVIADITTHNPNAMYELGIRHAAKPYRTIVMMEKNSSIPFDVSHNKIFTYCHLGEDIGKQEAEKCIKKLSELIIEIGKSENNDSPLFGHIKGISAHKLSEEEYSRFITDLTKAADSIFAITEKAKLEMKRDNFKEAAKYWKKACKKVKNDSYYTQQRALCTYKDKTADLKIALTDALAIINTLNPLDRETTDPETLGITGAIYKGLWENDVNTIKYLERAIDCYKRGFVRNYDYYTGENYALCLNIKAKNTSDDRERITYEYCAETTRKEIIDIIDKILESDDFEKRDDLKWIYATQAHCYYGIGDTEKHKKFEDRFFDLNPAEWEKETYQKSINTLTEILN